MSVRPSATAIGGFLLGALVLIVGGLVFFGGSLFGDKTNLRSAVVVFTGSVKGLNVGAPVTLRGVKIGDVREIGLRYDEQRGDFLTPVSITVDVSNLGTGAEAARRAAIEPLVERGLRAQLKTQSILTGLLYIDFDFLPGSEARYVPMESELPQIPTTPTEIEAILERVSEIDIQAFAQRADNTVRAIESLLGNPEMQALPANLNATLAEVRSLASTANREIAALGPRLDRLSQTAEGTLGDSRTEIRAIGERLDTSLRQLDTTLQSIGRTSEDVGYAMSDRGGALAELSRSVKEIGRAARAMQSLADEISQQPESLVRGRQAPEEVQE